MKEMQNKEADWNSARAVSDAALGAAQETAESHRLEGMNTKTLLDAEKEHGEGLSAMIAALKLDKQKLQGRGPVQAWATCRSDLNAAGLGFRTAKQAKIRVRQITPVRCP